VAAIDSIQQIMRDSNSLEVFTAACQAMCDMDIRDWLPKISSPALVLGGDEDLMTPWDQGPDGAGQDAIYEAIPNAEKHVIRGSTTRRCSTTRRAQPGRDRLLPAALEELMPGVEAYGVEPIPDELRRVGWRDLFAINFTFFLNPVMYVLGALAVVAGGLPLPWALAAMVLGQAIAFACLVPIAQAGVDYGLPGQVAMRGSLGFWGARVLSSPTASSRRRTGSRRRRSPVRSACRR
jgi:hypothetical protein